MPIRWRLTLFNAAVIGFILLVLGVSVFLLVRAALRSGVEGTVQSRALAVARTVESGRVLGSDDVEQLTLEGVFVVVRDGEGKVLARTIEARPDQSPDTMFWKEVLDTGEPAGGRVNTSGETQSYVFAVPVDPPVGPRIAPAIRSPFGPQKAPLPSTTAARVVEVSKSYETAAATVERLGAILIAGVLAIFLLSVGGAYLLARAALSPVEAVVDSARGITENDLSKRLPVDHPKDEIGSLAATINELLSRLEASFRRKEEALSSQREALASQRRFVADASHELRTPLTSISGYATMLRDWGLDDPRAGRKGAEGIHRESERMKRLVEDLLSLARGDEGLPLELCTHNLGVVADEAVKAARASDQGLSISYTPPSKPVSVSFDRGRIRQVADILLDNAVRYAPEGEVEVAVRERDGWAELEVSDTGAGMPAEQVSRIFERFYRVDAARAPGGAGLGLSIARQIAEAHRGRIDVGSKPGEGSTFTLRIPRNRYPSEAADARVPDERGSETT